MAGEDRMTFEAVFDRHFSEIYGYVAFRLTPRIADAQDITQDIFVAGLKAWGKFRGETTPLQWLRAIARRRIADYFGQRRATGWTEAISASVEVRRDRGDRERAEILSAVLRSVPPECAELLEEKYLDGLSVREIARRHGKTEKAIESALGRYRALVREEYRRFQKRTEVPHGSR